MSLEPKAKLGLSEGAYRAILAHVAGVASATELDQDGFTAVMGFMVHLGFDPIGQRGADHGARPGMASYAQLEPIPALSPSSPPPQPHVGGVRFPALAPCHPEFRTREPTCHAHQRGRHRTHLQGVQVHRHRGPARGRSELAEDRHDRAQRHPRGNLWLGWEIPAAPRVDRAAPHPQPVRPGLHHREPQLRKHCVGQARGHRRRPARGLQARLREHGPPRRPPSRGADLQPARQRLRGGLL